MGHPLDDWIESLVCVGIPENHEGQDEEQDEECEAQQLNLFDYLPVVLQPEFHISGTDSANQKIEKVFAYTPTSPDLKPQPHDKEVGDWPADQVRLLRMIYRRSQQEIIEFLENWGGDHWLKDGDDNLNEGELKKRESWLCPLDTLLQGSSLSTVKPEELFSIEVAKDATMISWTWGWFATALTKDLAVLSFWHDEMAGMNLLPEPLGLVTRENIFRSAALLFAYDDRKDYGRFRTEGNFYDEISFSGIDVANMYRLLLAICGEGGDELVAVSSKNIVYYSHEDMSYDFRYVARVVEATERMYERYKR